jgi:hypothetical protein
MRKLLILAAVAALFLVVLPIGPAGATPPSAVEFVIETEFPPGPDPGPSFGPFVATGSAVDDGIICETGDTIDVFGKASGFQSQTGVNFQIVKRFTCDDGSGEFLVKLQVRLDNKKGNNFNWTVVGGNGAYEDLHGTGKGFGLYDECGPDCVLDVLTGKLHID